MLGLGAATSLKGDLHQLKQYRTGSQLAIATTCIAVAELREHNVTNTTLLVSTTNAAIAVRTRPPC